LQFEKENFEKPVFHFIEAQGLKPGAFQAMGAHTFKLWGAHAFKLWLWVSWIQLVQPQPHLGAVLERDPDAGARHGAAVQERAVLVRHHLAAEEGSWLDTSFHFYSSHTSYFVYGTLGYW
jgi:hypothetical protein